MLFLHAAADVRFLKGVYALDAAQGACYLVVCADRIETVACMQQERKACSKAGASNVDGEH